jgi:hypothetical protein
MSRLVRIPWRPSHALTAAVLASALAAVLWAATTSSSSADAPGEGLEWVMATSSLENLSAPGLEDAASRLDSARTVVQSDPPPRDPRPEGWSVTRAEHFTSYATFAAAVEADQVPDYIETVHYDNESWAQTPSAEQAHPGLYERRFCALAHAHGWSCLTGPGQDLCGVLDHPQGDDYAHCYLDLDLAGKAAKSADIVDIQAQALEPRGPRAYSNFVRRAAAQARTANPDVRVLGNLSPTPDGTNVSARDIYRAAEAALPYVDGFYVTATDDTGVRMMAVVSRLEERAALLRRRSSR